MTTAHYQQHVKKSWTCQSCSNVNRRQRGDSTPVRSILGHAASDDSALNTCCEDQPVEEVLTVHSKRPEKGIVEKLSNASSVEQIGKMIDSKLLKIDKRLIQVQEQITRDLKSEFSKTIEKLKEEFTHTTDFLGAQMKELREDIKLAVKRITNLETDNDILRSELASVKNISEAPALMEAVTRLQQELDERDQAMLLSDVDISGIPEFEGESVMHIVITAAEKLGTKLDEREVISAKRMGPRRVHNQNSAPPRPRPIAVKLVRRALRDELLKNSRVRRGTTTEGLGLPNHDQKTFYVNERLTKKNRMIFGKAREAARTTNWKFVWTKEGRIFARRTDSLDAPVHQLRAESDIVRVFGNVPNCKNM